MQQFQPRQFIKLTAASVSVAIALPTDIVAPLALEISPTTGDGIFVLFGRSTVVAAEPGAAFALTGGTPVLVGQSKIIAVPKWATHMAYIRMNTTDSIFYTAVAAAIP